MSKVEEFIADVKDNYKESIDGWRHIYDAAASDMRFVYDVDEGQWPAGIRAKRETDGRPVLTINKLQKFVRQVRGDMQMNRARIKVIPVDSVSDPKMAELYNGIIRQIEYLSRADIAYDTAYMNSISCSIGFFRLITQYADDKSFNQDIFIKRILNPFSVHFDPYAQEFNLEDARYCFVEDLVDQKVFKKLYPKAEMTDFDSNSTQQLYGDWLRTDRVRVAEYYYKDTVRKQIVMLETGEVIPIDKKITMDALKAAGHKIKRDRWVEVPTVKWAKVTGVEILEETEWPIEDIPIIPVFGDEIVADGKKYYLSLIRGAKGPQEMYNYWATAATETVALAPKNPFIVEAKQVKGFEAEWEDAHLTNRMFIRYNAVAGLQKPSREPQTQVPSAIMNMMQTTAFDIEDHLGRYESSKGEASNERSGKAINARIAQSDKGTYSFADNMTRAQICAGRQIVKLIPKIYDTPRAMRIMGEDGTPEMAMVNQPTLGPEGPIIMNDLTVGKYDLIATVGPSTSSKRQEMVTAMTEAMQYAPAIAPYIAPLIFKYSDWPGADEVAAAITQGIQSAQASIEMKAG